MGRTQVLLPHPVGTSHLEIDRVTSPKMWCVHAISTYGLRMCILDGKGVQMIHESCRTLLDMPNMSSLGRLDVKKKFCTFGFGFGDSCIWLGSRKTFLSMIILKKGVNLCGLCVWHTFFNLMSHILFVNVFLWVCLNLDIEISSLINPNWGEWVHNYFIFCPFWKKKQITLYAQLNHGSYVIGIHCT